MRKNIKSVGLILSLTLVSLILLSAIPAWSTDYYVSADCGRGKSATVEKPAKDMGNINGSDVITVPVSVIGGYSDDFSKRDSSGPLFASNPVYSRKQPARHS